MSSQPEAQSETRAPLSRERVLRAAVDLADRDGFEALTMRNLAQELGVEAMSLYYHVENKAMLLDGVVEIVIGEINEAVDALDPPGGPDDWKSTTRRRILTAREVLLRHRWAPRLIETRSSVSPENVRYFDALVGFMRVGGFSYDLAHHALHALGSRALGFTQELFQPADPEEGEEEAMGELEAMAEELPHLFEMLAEISHDDPDSTLGWCDDQSEFEFGLDLILDGLERLRDSA